MPIHRPTTPTSAWVLTLSSYTTANKALVGRHLTSNIQQVQQIERDSEDPVNTSPLTVSALPLLALSDPSGDLLLIDRGLQSCSKRCGSKHTQTQDRWNVWKLKIVRIRRFSIYIVNFVWGIIDVKEIFIPIFWSTVSEFHPSSMIDLTGPMARALHARHGIVCWSSRLRFCIGHLTVGRQGISKRNKISASQFRHRCPKNSIISNLY